MLIRTQNKKGLVNLNNIDFITTGSEKSIITYFAGTQPQSLGTYSTKEKAIKVLDKIADAYCCSKYTENHFNGCTSVPSIVESNVVFEMPQDKEVIG